MPMSEILEALNLLEELRKKSLDEILKDKILTSAILWNLYIVVQGCIDLGLKAITELGLRTAESYSDVFNVLSESNLISKELKEKLISMARFRNILAHMYAHIDISLVYKILQNNLDYIKEYIRELTRSLSKFGIKPENL